MMRTLGSIWLVCFIFGTFMGCRKSENVQKYEGPGLLTYQSQCTSCHQNKGEGMQGVPSLVGTDWVTGDSSRLIRLMLHGVEGKMQIKGETFDVPMPSFSQLDDRDIADVLTYIRGAWGNKATEISAKQVRTLRLFHQDRTTPWKVDELNEPAQQKMPTIAVLVR